MDCSGDPKHGGGGDPEHGGGDVCNKVGKYGGGELVSTLSPSNASSVAPMDGSGDSEGGGGGGPKHDGGDVGDKVGERSGHLLSDASSVVPLACVGDPKHGGCGGGDVGDKGCQRSGHLLSDASCLVSLDCVGDLKHGSGELVSTLSPSTSTLHTGGREIAVARCGFGNLPDDVVGKIMSFLATNEGARFALFSSRWRNVWRLTPLRMDDHLFGGSDARLLLRCINGVILNHPGPVHRIAFSRLPIDTLNRAIGDWIQLPIFDGLQELSLNFPGGCKELPGSMLKLRSVHTLHLTNCTVPSDDKLEFPLLRDFRIVGVKIMECTLKHILSSARSLHTLVLSLSSGYSLLQFSAPNLKHLVISLDRKNGDGQYLEHISIQEATSLNRLLVHHENDAPSIAIRGASNLDIMGHIGREINPLQIENTMYKNLLPCSLGNVISSVKVLSLKVECQDLQYVLKFLSTVPCLEILHIHLKGSSSEDMSLESDGYASPDCLRSTVKKIVFWSYIGSPNESKFARYFVQNAKFVQLFQFQTWQTYTASWLESQCYFLKSDGKLSHTARFEFALEKPSAPSLDQLIDTEDPFGLMFGQAYLCTQGTIN